MLNISGAQDDQTFERREKHDVISYNGLTLATLMNISTIYFCNPTLDMLCQIYTHVLKSSNAHTTFERADLSVGAQDHQTAS